MSDDLIVIGTGPHRPGVVKRPRRSSASLRPLRGDNAGSMRLFVSMVFVVQRRRKAGFTEQRS
jgi:hypothetical protein